MRIIPPDQPRTPGPRILFAEDFDDLPAPASAPEPEQPPPAPMLTEADVEAARREGHAAGLHAARQQAWMHLAEATAARDVLRAVAGRCAAAAARYQQQLVAEQRRCEELATVTRGYMQAAAQVRCC